APSNQSTISERSVLIPTFPPTIVAPPRFLTTIPVPSSNSTQNMSSISTTNANLRLASEALFKSNSVHRYPSTQFTCSDCHRIVRVCDVSVQASLDNKIDENAASRLRLVSLTSSDDGLAGDDAWFSFDSPLNGQKNHTNHPIQVLKDERYDGLSKCTLPKMHHV
ncbi:unnamed protein product, partial [Rotaria magnacalcarata]